jgi:hypothetical protein
MKISAVITGDLIKSRSASAAAMNAAFDTLRAAAEEFGQDWGLDLRFTRFRGDGWQVVLTNPQLTLHAVVFLIARLRAEHPKINTRLAIGIGSVDTLGTHDLSDANGAAFVISGHHLDKMSRKRTLTITGYGIGATQAAIIGFIEFITATWTAAQAEAVAHAMRGFPRTQDDIAAELGITRQAVQSRLASAGLAYLENALQAFKDHDFKTPPLDE